MLIQRIGDLIVINNTDEFKNFIDSNNFIGVEISLERYFIVCVGLVNDDDGDSYEGYILLDSELDIYNTCPSDFIELYEMLSNDEPNSEKYNGEKFQLYVAKDYDELSKWITFKI